MTSSNNYYIVIIQNKGCAVDEFRKICQKHQLKVTPQRVAIYKELLNDAGHPTADTVYQKVKEVFPSISFDTVNRTLIRFTQIGLIGTIECSGQGKKYDPNLKRHHHFKCIHCGIILDFYHSPFDDLKVPAEKIMNFKVINRKVVLTGICERCSPGY